MLTRGNSCRTYAARLKALGLVALWMMMGCGGGGAPVNRDSALDGAIRWADGTDAGQLAGGTVEFEGVADAKAEVGSDGTFTLKSAPPTGKYKVRVMPPAGKSVLDPRFQDFSKSGLVADVAPPKLVILSVGRPR